MKNVKKVVIPVALAVTMSLSAFLASCGKEPPTTEDAWRDQSIWLQQDGFIPLEAAELPEDVNYKTPSASVHDPSIFHDPVSDAYYAYGTHYAVAKTYELADAFRSAKEGGWEQLAGDNNYKFLYGEGDFLHTGSGVRWPNAIRETVELVNPGGSSPGTTTWAPDVEYMGGKYYMYYSLTHHFGSNKSAIARVESDSPEGPFSNNKIVIDSMGANSSKDPNCIDPELFYDKEGKLWMVYGSASAGIFIKELHADGENIGLPIRTKEEEGFGKLLWKAGGNAGKNEEGPFVFYNASSDYYYLMTSHASLMSTYNMHVARSKNPDGPYVGIDGKDVAADGDGNLVAGNFKFARDGKGGAVSAALGHNSVVKDKSGKYYVVYHARTSTDSGAVSSPHNLYVSQMYFNEDFWPVMAPTPYVGETRGTMTMAQVAGSYDIVVHEVPRKLSGTNTASHVNSVKYTLTADGKITGTGVGNEDFWRMTDDYYIEIMLNDVSYKGVVAPGWDVYTSATSQQKGVITITAVSETGIPLWAVQN